KPLARIVRRLPPQEGLPPPCASPCERSTQGLTTRATTRTHASARNRLTLENRLHKIVDTTSSPLPTSVALEIESVTGPGSPETQPLPEAKNFLLIEPQRSTDKLTT